MLKYTQRKATNFKLNVCRQMFVTAVSILCLVYLLFHIMKYLLNQTRKRDFRHDARGVLIDPLRFVFSIVLK